MSMLLRVLTYNIHKGIGGIDRRYRPERILETIAHNDPDVIFLQEVDNGVPRSNHHEQIELIGDELDYPHRIYQPNVSLTTGCYGNAILSRFPLTDEHHEDLTVPLKKNRRALFAHCRVRFEGHSRTVLLVNTHLGLAGYERNMQMQRILRTNMLQHTHQHTPVVLGGDFNDVWGGLGQKWLVPEGFLSACGRIRTFPAVYPVRPLDRLFFRGDIALDHSFAGHTKIARQASDHLPLVADFYIKAELEAKGG